MVDVPWMDGYVIVVERSDRETVIRGNAAGLISLARQLTSLAQDSVSPGSHIHLTDSVELEPGSGDLILDRLDNR